MTTEIVLEGADMLQATYHAAVIRGVKAVRAADGAVRNRRVSRLNDFGTHFVGMLGEVAVAKALGVPLRTDQTTGGDGCVDLVVDGQRVQVKTSSWASLPRERLVIVERAEELQAEWLVSCAVKWPTTVEIHGFISRLRFLRTAFRHDFGYGAKLCVKADALQDIGLFGAAVDVMRARLAQAAQRAAS